MPRTCLGCGQVGHRLESCSSKAAMEIRRLRSKLEKTDTKPGQGTIPVGRSHSVACAHTSCYGVGSSLALVHIRHATLCDLLLHLRTYVMLRCGIFSCTWRTYVMLRCGISSCTCAHTSCYAEGSSLALAHIRHATLWDLLLHCAHTSRYAVGSSLALACIRPATLWDLLLHLAHIRHATLWDLLLHLRTYVLLRCGIFSCTAHIRHATLWNLLVHLRTYVLLHCGIFSCTWTYVRKCTRRFHSVAWRMCASAREDPTV